MSTTTARRRRTATIALITGALAATALAAAPAQAGPATADITAAGTTSGTDRTATRTALATIVANGHPGVTATVTDANGVWKHATGAGNLRTGKKRGENDRYRIASITKTFVATVLLQLEAEGKLDLDDTVDKWLPGAVQGHGHDGRKITVRQLLNHTSGVYDYLADADYRTKYLSVPGFAKHRYDYRSPWAAVRYAMKNPPTHQPGAGHTYSNTNYVLAGLIIEKAGGRTYEKELRDRIFKPLKLRATSSPGDSSLMPRPSSRAYTYLAEEPTGALIDATVQNASQSWGDGEMISDGADLNRFLGALMQGKLLPPEQLKAMKTIIPDPEWPGSGYGLGLTAFPTSCGKTVWGHSGGWIGSLSFAVTTEDGRHSLSYNTNGDWRNPALFAPVEAEFCGTTPKPAAAGALDKSASLRIGDRS
ncbi:serine hydrolase domain-containing protein [Streptomyces sp. NPDC020875]|uniref:serine hydrolase domain-containing protein n=1 Tax=Streptomyces sp. NPDC020875 TaxID=3154898 RepID=UPI0033CD93AE